MTKKIILPSLLLILLQMLGCGGGGGSAPAGSYKATISFSLVSTAKLPYRILGVQVNGSLPTGFSVTTGNVASPKTITAGLLPGAAIGTLANWQSGVLGTYSAPNKVRLSFVDGTSTQTGFGPGEMMRLTCSVAAGTTVSESQRQALENAITFSASGWDPNSASNPSSLKSFLVPRVAVTIN